MNTVSSLMQDNIISHSRKQHANDLFKSCMKVEAAEPRNLVSCPNPALQEQYPWVYFKSLVDSCVFPSSPDVMGRLIILFRAAN